MLSKDTYQEPKLVHGRPAGRTCHARLPHVHDPQHVRSMCERIRLWLGAGNTDMCHRIIQELEADGRPLEKREVTDLYTLASLEQKWIRCLREGGFEYIGDLDGHCEFTLACYPKIKQAGAAAIMAALRHAKRQWDELVHPPLCWTITCWSPR